MSAFDEIERVARLSHGRLVAILASRTGNVTAAMDALSDAVVRALEVWHLHGVPANPEAWLVATARNRAADAGRNVARAAAATERKMRQKLEGEMGTGRSKETGGDDVLALLEGN